MVEKKEIKTKKELEMEKSEGKSVDIEKEEVKDRSEEVKEEAKSSLEDIKGQIEETDISDVEKSLEKGRGTAQKIFEDMISTFRDKQGDFEKAMSEYTASSAKMAIDVIESDNAIIVKTDLPGVKKEDIVIDLSEDELEVMAIFGDESEFEGENFVKKERRYGESKRRVSITQPIKIDESSAKFDNGVLTVTIPKEEKRRQQLKLE